MKSYSFKDKHVLITGASGGLGSAMVKFLSDMGARLAVTSRSEKALSQLISELPQKENTVAITADLSQSREVEKLAREAISVLGHIDVLINNAGIGYFALMEEATPDNMRQLFEVNTFAPMAMIQALLPQMKKRGATIALPRKAFVSSPTRMRRRRR